MSETDPLKAQNDPTLHGAGQALFSEIRQLIDRQKRLPYSKDEPS